MQATSLLNRFVIYFQSNERLHLFSPKISHGIKAIFKTLISFTKFLHCKFLIMTKYYMKLQSSASKINFKPEANSSANIQESSSLLITTHKLNGHNFLQWSQYVLMYVCGKGNEKYLTDEISIPKKSNPKHRIWKTKNHMDMLWLINSMTTKVGEIFWLYKTAKEIWNEARETYSNS